MILNGIFIGLTEFVEAHKTFSILVLIVIIHFFFRVTFNLITFNKIHKTNFIEGTELLHRDGGLVVYFIMFFVFWWFIKESDNEKIRQFKVTSNIVSMVTVIFTVILILKI